jgi:4-alpha-glucanotransferase
MGGAETGRLPGEPSPEVPSVNLERCSGVLLHPTSLPGPHGVGSFDQEAYDWIDFLVASQQTVWQVLPLGPTSFGDSPYQSFSTHAGNPYLLGLNRMVADGLLEACDLAEVPSFPSDRVDFGGLFHWKLPLLKKAAGRLDASAPTPQAADFREFCQAEAWWLEDYALFMALKDAFDSQAWNQWPEELRLRRPEALDQARSRHAPALHAHRFMQWVFDRQWKALREYANQRGIRILGDLPIFVAMDSADVWTQTDLFHFDARNQPTVVAGVPPDYFSATGQLWGNPLYRWDRMAQTGYRWWIDRLRSALARHDLVRIDHFRGFAAYWEVPAEAETAVTGRWVQGPGPAARAGRRSAHRGRGSGGHHPGGPGSARRVRTARHEGAAVRIRGPGRQPVPAPQLYRTLRGLQRDPRQRHVAGLV